MRERSTRKRAALIGLVLAVGAVLVPTAAASATGAVVGGGNWNYGVAGGKVTSNYWHASKYHSATACNNGAVDKCRYAYANKNVWAKASHASSIFGGNTAYWNTY